MDSYRSLHPYDGTDESTLLAQPGRRVDYIFVDQSLTRFVSSSYIVDNEGVRTASDHRPVVTEFRFGANDTLRGRRPATRASRSAEEQGPPALRTAPQAARPKPLPPAQLRDRERRYPRRSSRYVVRGVRNGGRRTVVLRRTGCRPSPWPPPSPTGWARRAGTHSGPCRTSPGPTGHHRRRPH